jgi:hypothetical protein
MDWTQTLTTIASILIPLLGCFGWMIHRMDKMREDINKDLRHLDSRLSKLEGMMQK